MLLIVIILLAFAFIFGSQNPQTITLNYLIARSELSVAGRMRGDPTRASRVPVSTSHARTATALAPVTPLRQRTIPWRRSA